MKAQIKTIPILLLVLSFTSTLAAEDAVYRSPYDLAFSPDGQWLAVSDATAGCLYLVSPEKRSLEKTVALKGSPRGVVWKDNRIVLVAEYENATVALIDAKAGKVKDRWEVGRKTIGIDYCRETGGLLACDFGLNRAVVSTPKTWMGLKRSREMTSIDGMRHPSFGSFSSDGSTAVVFESLPPGRATEPLKQTLNGWVIDVKGKEKPATIPLPGGTANGREISISPDGHWAYALHTRGRVDLPTSQIERGWIITNAMTILDLEKEERFATILFDRVYEGAADPWGITLSRDGSKAWVTLSGIHEIAKIDLGRLIPYLQGNYETGESETAASRSDSYARDPAGFWSEVAENPLKRLELVDDLGVVHASGLVERFKIPVKGPRGIDLSPDESMLATAGYFDGKLLLVRPEDGIVLEEIALGDQPEMDERRWGEMLFYDGSRCYQGWMSCVSCHPDGRADGQNWDLLNDGIGNAKNAKSMVWTDRTPPAMWTGVRANYEIATIAGMKFFQYNIPSDQELAAVKAYLRSLEPEASPWFEMDDKGAYSLSASAEKGKNIFEYSGCLDCHPRPLYTDLLLHDVGTRGEYDRHDAFDTPQLIELWRTEPFLHDGRAATLEELLKEHNKGDFRGVTSELSDKQVDHLIKYLNSLPELENRGGDD